MDIIKNKILQKIKMEQEISPFLFIGENFELTQENIKNLALEILKELNIPKTELHIFSTDENTIKIKELKEFLSKTNIKSPYQVQIFIINNFSKATISAANSSLKILEEPKIGNLIFLTDISESGILDTILSRVQTIKLNNNLTKIKNNFFYELINDFINNQNHNLIKYFFSKKLEKKEYIDFLQTLLDYFIKNFIFIDSLEDLQDDIEKISKNNVSARYVCDKWILIVNRCS